MQVGTERLRRPKFHRLVCFSRFFLPASCARGEASRKPKQGMYANQSCSGTEPRILFVLFGCSHCVRAPLAMSYSLAAVSPCVLLLFSQHAQAFQLAPSSFQSTTRVKPFESLPALASTHHASWAATARPPRRLRQRSFGTMSLSDPAGSGNGGAGGGDSWFSEWKRSLVAASVALSIFGGSVLTTSPARLLPLQDGGRSSSSVAMAAMAPSLMQDEKGYISIFEKVIALLRLSDTVCCPHLSTAVTWSPEMYNF